MGISTALERTTALPRPIQSPRSCSKSSKTTMAPRCRVGDLLPPRGVPKLSRHQSSPLSESRASWPCNKRWVLDHQYQRSSSCLNPEYRQRRQPRERTGSHQRPRAGRKEFSRPFEEVVMTARTTTCPLC